MGSTSPLKSFYFYFYFFPANLISVRVTLGRCVICPAGRELNYSLALRWLFVVLFNLFLCPTTMGEGAFLSDRAARCVRVYRFSVLFLGCTSYRFCVLSVFFFVFFACKAFRAPARAGDETVSSCGESGEEAPAEGGQDESSGHRSRIFQGLPLSCSADGCSVSGKRRYPC